MMTLQWGDLGPVLQVTLLESILKWNMCLFGHKQLPLLCLRQAVSGVMGEIMTKS